MTDIHAGCRVPPSEMDEIPMSNSHSRSPRARPMENSRSTGQYQRRLDAENYWNYVIQHRLAVIIGVLLVAIFLAFIAIVTYLAIKPDKNYAAVEIDKVIEMKYPAATKKAITDQLQDQIGAQIPVFNIQDELSEDMFDALNKNAYKIISDQQSNRFKRQTESEDIESCKERHEHCKILLDKIKKLTKNVSQQVQQLQKMINKVGLLNGQEQLPSLSNITALDYAICLKCEKLENETSNVKIAEILPLDVREVDIPSESKANITDDATFVIKNETLSINANVIDPEMNQSEVFENTANSEAPYESGGLFFRHSQLNKMLMNKPEMSESTYLSIPEIISETIAVTTEYNVPVSTEATAANKAQKIAKSDSDEPMTLPRAKSNYELNPFAIPTAETSKTSQQMTYTPNISWMPYPLCIFGPSNPSPQTVRESSSGTITFPVTSPASLTTQDQQFQYGQPLVPPTGNEQTYYHYPNSVQPVHPVQPPQPGVQFVPIQFQPTSASAPPQRFGPTGPGVQYFPVVPGNHQPTTTGQARPVYCTYLPTPTFQFPAMPGVSEFQRAASEPNSPGTAVLDHDEQELKSRDYVAGCPPTTRACSDYSGCIPKLRWCDGRVDCADASDETHCSCRDRVDKERLCDGYFDCPLGEDELGCFGCDKHMFSCDDSERRQRWGNCLPIDQRCDGYAQCSNGKDELHCSIITQSVEQREMFAVGYTMGYLHQNWRGKWYPTCSVVSPWASDACRAEIGDNNYRDFPVVKSVPLQQQYNGPYIVQLSFNKVDIVDSCDNKAVFVMCPEIPCGTRVSSEQDNSPFGFPYIEQLTSNGFDQAYPNTFSSYKSKDTNEQVVAKEEGDQLENDEISSDTDRTSSNTTTDNKDEILGSSRVVGGYPSQPKAWPSLVAINRDGSFHCGGVILDKIWILTAAHCVDGYRKHYFDIQAGMLRRFSYSPMEQSRKVSHLVIYPNYDRAIMKNDIALLRLETPLHFNRWVRPACLPEATTAGPHWRAGPLADTTCISAGWGSMVEHGPDPDHLREVELPILPNCKNFADQNEAEICAGALQGGHDTCQGDSGGPLMCRNPNSPSQWYVAGIVSHGEGCARPNEPGAYTKVGRFVEWINEIRFQHKLPKYGPSQRCPGYYCHSGSQKCYPAKRRCDKTVDCIDAEDELNCPRTGNFPFFRSADSVANETQTAATESSSTTTETNQSETTLQTESITTTSFTESTSTIRIPSSSTESTTEQPTTELTTIEQTTTKQPTTEQITTEQTTTEQTTTIQQSTEQSRLNDNIVISQNKETNIPTEEATILPPMALTHFSCKHLIQTIDIKKRCDRVVDCEDGTDEEDCTCRDYLSKTNPASICDGHIDCLDNTDEENCEICSPGEFHCRRSGECVPLSKRCDRKPDCDFNEDELYCLTLTNGKYLITDIDGVPHQNSEGILTIYEKEKWLPFCIDKRADKPATLGKQMCSYFGFSALESFNETRMQNAPLEVRASTVENIMPYEYSSLYSVATDDEPRCTALYLRCVPTIHTVSLTYRVKGITDDGEDTYLWPWHAAIFVDGRYRCSAVLLEPNWLLTSYYCTDDIDLKLNYTVALLGVSRSYLEVDGPHQQMSIVDEIRKVKDSDAILIHLKYPANITRHVQPMYLQKRTHPPAESDTCATIGVDENGRARTIFLQAVVHNCPDNRRCYKDIQPKKCENETLTTPWSGTVMCHGCSGWYPAAVYHKEAGPCSFETKQSLLSIDYINTNLITGMQEPLRPSKGANCDGFRCPLGNCLDLKKICDGVPHCRDGADENAKFCEGMKDRCTNNVNEAVGCHCSRSELRCANGQCVPKSAFCDGENDCADGTDEPTECNCAAYLRLTAPNRICDGRRHCLDKSDENPDICLCKDASFKCDESGDVCVSPDFVCDGQPDCSSGDDEKQCQTLKTLPSSSIGYGEVMQRSYGVWHSQCFPAGALADNDNSAADLCASFGYSKVKNITESDAPGDAPGNAPAVPVLDKFYMVRLNRRTWVVMRDDKALVSLHPPHETCYRHYVTCA